MKKYSAKTLEEALAAAAADLGQPVEALSYTVSEEKKSLFSKKITIEVAEISDAIAYAEKYLVDAIATFGITATAKSTISDDVIRISLDSDHNSILIGKNGNTLQALNELTKLSVSSKFKKRFRILLDINEYKDSKYEKLISIARRTALDVQRTKIPATLEAMPADERRVIHNALNGMPHIKTESVGEGHHRQITINYVE
ncbi:MAG: Jag N-terminal domain-containing protein [Firmicutes bacterium]|nr:Jag N-terminal domain-containing protein [Bacillota bacterium]